MTNKIEVKCSKDDPYKYLISKTNEDNLVIEAIYWTIEDLEKLYGRLRTIFAGEGKI